VAELPATRFADNDGLTIAYQVVGEGPLDLVVVPGFMSHVELNWEFPFFGGFLERLSDFARVVILDKRGTGLSDRSLGLGTFEERMADLRAVMDAASVSSAAVLGISEGAAVAALLAASHPERVRALVLSGGFCPGGPSLPAEVQEALLTSIARDWYSGKVLDFFVQHAPDPDLAVARLARFERYCCTPAVAVEIMRRTFESDIAGVLPTISVPTLVHHQRDDPVCGVAHARFFADHIPGARLELVDGDFHGSWRPSDYDATIAAVRRFLTGEAVVAPSAPDRMLATVLFTDIVDSTATAARLGDDRWREILDRHDRAAREEVEVHGGTFVKATGDGLLARFEGPTRAVSCAHALAARVAPLGIEVRAGAHTGEVERRGDDIGGLAVHVAARVAALAGPGEVLVTRTVKDLTVGAALDFDDRGDHELKGVPDDWRLYAASL
jgi:class 3 adenylate cyclase